MKTTSVKINPDAGWQKLSTLAELSFVADNSYSLQVKGAGAFIALNTEAPTESAYYVLDELEKFGWTFDGTNDLWVKPRSEARALTVVFS